MYFLQHLFTEKGADSLGDTSDSDLTAACLLSVNENLSLPYQVIKYTVELCYNGTCWTFKNMPLYQSAVITENTLKKNLIDVTHNKSFLCRYYQQGGVTVFMSQGSFSHKG